MINTMIPYIYGASTMYYGMTAWLFGRKHDILSRLVALLMLTICLECIKDLVFMVHIGPFDRLEWTQMTAFDMIAVPMYTFILVELVRPGSFRLKSLLLHEIPFVILPILTLATGNIWIYDALLGYSFLYGTCVLFWTLRHITLYHRQLKERFSYTENVNLRWLRAILYTFYLILALWIVNCTMVHAEIDGVYMLSSLLLWIIIEFYLNKHENVMDELCNNEPATTIENEEEHTVEDLNRRIEALFTEEKIFLNPNLKLSDIASAVCSNRTYISGFFNKESGTSFYDYVNKYRIEYACSLLKSSPNDSIKNISTLSGFNSPQSFIRVFQKFKGISPSAYREQK